MKLVMTALVLLVCVGSPRWSAPPQYSPSPQSTCCTIVREAYDEAMQLKPGMTRREVEEHFAFDGGMQFWDKTRFVSTKCHYLMVDVSFKRAKPVDAPESLPDDVATKISAVYVHAPSTE